MWNVECGLTASSQCLKANFCAFSFLDKPLPTYNQPYNIIQSSIMYKGIFAKCKI
jgi:hypothetical protein